jgi:hypothetical protein
MLEVLEWRLHPVTPCDFMMHLVMVCRPESTSGLLSVVSTALNLLRQTAGSQLELQHLPSAVAIAALALAIQTTGVCDVEQFSDAIKGLSLSPFCNQQFWDFSVSPCFSWMDNQFSSGLKRPAVAVPSIGIWEQEPPKSGFMSSPTSVSQMVCPVPTALLAGQPVSTALPFP